MSSEKKLYDESLGRVFYLLYPGSRICESREFRTYEFIRYIEGLAGIRYIGVLLCFSAFCSLYRGSEIYGSEI